MPRVVCRRGVAPGALSAAFCPEDLLAALHGDDPDYVYVEPDAAGRLALAGGGGRAQGEGEERGEARAAARLCVLARPAPHRPGAGAELCAAGGALHVRVVRALAPHAELRVWFADGVLCALDMPFLTPRHLDAAGAGYACPRCGAAFAEPNPLKLHLFLACRPYSARAFWREACSRLLVASPPARASPGLPAAELEALAAELGRSVAGHACVYCGKLYSRRYGLKIHLRTHTGYRPLRCRHCLRAFGDPSNLNKHVRLHARNAYTRPTPSPG